jgi:hypothetical protein
MPGEYWWVFKSFPQPPWQKIFDTGSRGCMHCHVTWSVDVCKNMTAMVNAGDAPGTYGVHSRAQHHEFCISQSTQSLHNMLLGKVSSDEILRYHSFYCCFSSDCSCV